jgi:hypothetical protein
MREAECRRGKHCSPNGELGGVLGFVFGVAGSGRRRSIGFALGRHRAGLSATFSEVSRTRLARTTGLVLPAHPVGRGERQMGLISEFWEPAESVDRVPLDWNCHSCPRLCLSPAAFAEVFSCQSARDGEGLRIYSAGSHSFSSLVFGQD